jgi:secretion/DNA translocation related TadE-like protein
MLMVGVMTVVLMLSLGGICLAGYLVAVHRARATADLAALSGAAVLATGGDACGAARRNAENNKGRLVSCDQVGDQVDFVVTVQVEVRVTTGVAGLPRSIRAVAHAGSGPP